MRPHIESLLREIHELVDDWGVVHLLFPLLRVGDLLAGLGAANSQWRSLVTASDYDEIIWKRRLARWELPSLDAVWLACGKDKLRSACSWRDAYKILAYDAFFWDALSVSELVYSNGARMCPSIVAKKHRHPDVSFAFARGGFTAGVVCWRVLIRDLGDELRIGVTDDRTALVNQDFPGLSYEAPNLWCYSDGSIVSHAYANGQRVGGTGKRRRRWRPGDVVTVLLNFEARKLSFFLNGEGACQIEGEHFPSTCHPLFPVAVLDERADQLELLPLDASNFSMDWEPLVSSRATGYL